jgi:hypothetical protein
MVRRLVGTLSDVQHDLFLVNEVAAMWWASQGYTVIQTQTGKAVVGKNSLTGEDNPQGLTTTWDIPKPVNFTYDEQTGEQIPDEGTEWYIVDPASDARFVDWRLYIPEGVTLKTRTEDHESPNN